jgi:hypothetical protein
VLRLRSELLQEQGSALAGSKTLLLSRMTALVLKAEGVYKRIVQRILQKFSFFECVIKYKGN